MQWKLAKDFQIFVEKVIKMYSIQNQFKRKK